MAASTALNRDDYRAIFLNDVPMMDVRAPVEFAKGAFPGVINLPLMDDTLVPVASPAFPGLAKAAQETSLTA